MSRHRAQLQPPRWPTGAWLVLAFAIIAGVTVILCVWLTTR